MGVFADFRTDIAVALGDACTGHPNWNVYPLPVESPSPPCFLLLWGDPWIEGPASFCTYQGHLDVRIVSNRLEPDTGIETLELMVEAAAAELYKANHPIRELSVPTPYTVNNVGYQSAVMLLDTIVQLNGGT